MTPRSRAALLLLMVAAACVPKTTDGTGEEIGTHMSITTPGNAPAGSVFGPVIVDDLDASGTVATDFSSPVTLGLGDYPGGPTAPPPTLSGTTTQSAVAGVATFSGLTLTKAGAYTLKASSPGQTSATSGSFSITPGPQAKLEVSGPMTVQAGTIFTWVVTVTDAFGNTVDYNGTVGLSLPSNSTGKLTGTTVAVAAHGVAQFSVSVTPAGTYTVNVFNAGLTSTASLVVN